MDKRREDFEKWAAEQLGWTPERFEMHAGNYLNGRTYERWATWNAALDSRFVELPETCCRTLVFEQDNTLEAGMIHDEYFEVDDIKCALNKAGIKYK